MVVFVETAEGVGEAFVVRVFKGGKVTVPVHVREVAGVVDGDYVRLELVEVLRREGGVWVKRRVE
jgi:bifunctional DNA-binding transcriptional regulator/antitoxin component of YhaV-PrlF toxin-antitoxin module